jgi:hypothetical protein
MLAEWKQAPDSAVSIIESLAHARDAASIPLIRTVFLDKTTRAEIRREALGALDQLDAPDVMDLCLSTYPSLDARKDPLLYGIALIFEKRGDERAIPMLRKMQEVLEDGDELKIEANIAIDAIQARIKARK